MLAHVRSLQDVCGSLKGLKWMILTIFEGLMWAIFSDILKKVYLGIFSSNCMTPPPPPVFVCALPIDWLKSCGQARMHFTCDSKSYSGP